MPTATIRRGIPALKTEGRQNEPTTDKVRYWPGKVPKASKYDNSDSEDELAFSKLDKKSTNTNTTTPRTNVRDPRLERLKKAAKRRREDGKERRHRVEAEEIEDESAAHRKAVMEMMRMERIMAQQDGVAGLEDDEDEDEIANRRQRLREKQRRIEHDEVLDRIEEEEEESNKEDQRSEYEEVTDEEQDNHDIKMAKPIFVKSSDRITVKEREKMEKEEKELKEKAEQRIEERKKDTRQLVVETIKKEMETLKNTSVDSDEEIMPSDDDEVNEAEEYEKWKVRELLRVKAYREDREKWEKEKLEVERRRNMTDEQRRKEDADYERLHPELKDPKVKWKFLQKYYHKGAFFMDTKDKGLESQQLYQRDYGHATGEDKFDKSMLPKVMQVKNFGKSGRVKWTHLVNEDTTVKATDNIFTSGTAAAAVGGGSTNFAHNMTYNTQHFTYAHQKQETLGSSKYGADKVTKDKLLERPAARRRNQKV